MFRLVSITVFLILGFFYFRLIRSGKITSGKVWELIQQKTKSQMEIFRRFSERPMMERFVLLRSVLFIAMTLMFLILFLTGFISVLIFGDGKLSGLLLIAHVLAAPIFIFLLMFWIFLRAHFMQFSIDDWRFLKSMLRKTENRLSETALLHGFWFKLLFWLFIATIVPATLSIIISMFPLFATEGMEVLLRIHQFCALILAIIAADVVYIQLIRIKKL